MRLLTVRRRHSQSQSSSHPQSPSRNEMAALMVDDRVLPLAALGRTGDPATELDESLARQDIVGLLRLDPDLAETRRALEGALSRRPDFAAASSRPLEEFRLAAPIPRPGKIVCIGLNYRDHIEEQHIAVPSRPTLFAKFANAVVADREPVIRHGYTHALDLEVELGVVIGRAAQRVAAADAARCIAGYTVLNDVTARDLQGQKQALGPGERGDGQWLRAKGSDTFLPMGPVIVTPDELSFAGADPAALRLRSWRVTGTAADGSAEEPRDEPGRGMLMQDGTTADMLVDVAHLIEFVSGAISLEPGDVIATGTPAGVGVFRDPPLFLEPGDVMRVDVECIGSITNPIVDSTGAAPEGSPAAALLSDRSAPASFQP